MDFTQLQAGPKKELDTAGFRMDAPDLALGWEVFKRSLAQPLTNDAGGYVRGEEVGRRYSLVSARRYEDGYECCLALELSFECPLVAALRQAALQFDWG